MKCCTLLSRNISRYTSAFFNCRLFSFLTQEFHCIHTSCPHISWSVTFWQRFKFSNHLSTHHIPLSQLQLSLPPSLLPFQIGSEDQWVNPLPLWRGTLPFCPQKQRDSWTEPLVTMSVTSLSPTPLYLPCNKWLCHQVCGEDPGRTAACREGMRNVTQLVDSTANNMC